jgi:hypothetical protein
MNRIGIHIATCADFVSERKATLERLLEQLRTQTSCVTVHRSPQREHASVWATRMYRVAAAEDARGAVFLNDDVEVPSAFVEACDAFLNLPTSRIVSLAVVHPISRSIGEAGHRWLSTYHVTGPGYLFRRGVAKEVLAFYAESPKEWTSSVNEDNVLIQYLFRHRDPAWSCVPGLVLHDTSVASTLGYDTHPGRICPVAWTDPLFKDSPLSEPHFWRPTSEVPFIETHWTDHRALVTQEVANDLGVGADTCWHCGLEPWVQGSEKTGARIGAKCMYAGIGMMFNRALGVRTKDG